VLLLAGVAAAAPSGEELAFFETRIRPVLAEHCYPCHSAEALRAGKLKAGLLVDTRAGMANGGESGAAVVPGDRAGSLILAALKHDGFEMPPAGRLPDPVIADFEKWIDMGAPDPREEPSMAIEERTIDVAAGRRHWSYRRLAPVSPPAVANTAWPRGDIDRFILAAQERAGIAPAAEAEKAVLARRVSFDLTGLPPTPEELAAFLQDGSADAYEKLVDRLLASPGYGERWARHWLDTVRFAESGGYEFDGDRPGAHHYRDWVIRALNADLPYDEFLRLQIAGDLVKPGDYDATSATGFLVAGPYPGQVTAKTVEPIRYDQLDDMLATLGSSVLGMTIGCARCHDHKYDAIAHRDYYAMLACLGKAVQRDTDIDLDPEGTRRKREAWQAERAPVAAAEEAFRRDELPGRLARWLAAEAPVQLAAAPWIALDPQALKAAKATLAKDAAGIVTATGKLEGNDTYTLTFRTRLRDLAALRIEPLAAEKATENGTARAGPGTGKDGAFRLSTVKVTAAPLVAAPDRKNVQPNLRAVAATAEEAGFEFAKALDSAPDTGWSVGGPAGRDHAAVVAFDRPIGFEGGTILTVELRFEANQHGLARFRIAAAADPAAGIAAAAAPQSPREVALLLDAAAAGPGLAERGISREIAGWFARLDDRTQRVVADLAAADAREPQPNLVKVYAATNGAWVISGNSQGVSAGSQDVFVLGRGEVGRKKGKAAPGFVLATIPEDAAESSLLSGPDAKPLGDSRLGLAAFVTDVSRGAGPLAARVLVNRLWHHHFGRGIVATPNDLGTQGEPPSHPELLEWLANRFVESGWSVKGVHRLIVTSATYRQSGAVSAAGHALDPDNRLLWHRRPARLEGEAIRDALLSSSGLLDPTRHGRAGRDASSRRRSIYLEIKRSEPIGFLQVFDQPEAVQAVGARGVATVPTQALAMLNSPLVRTAAENLATKCREAAAAAGAGSPAGIAAAIDRAFVAALERHPTAAEGERFTGPVAAREAAAGADGGRRQQALVDACQLIYCMNEFIYVD